MIYQKWFSSHSRFTPWSPHSSQTAALVTQTVGKVIYKSQQCQIESEVARRWWDYLKLCQEARHCGEGGRGGLLRLEQPRQNGSSGVADVILRGKMDWEFAGSTAWLTPATRPPQDHGGPWHHFKKSNLCFLGEIRSEHQASQVPDKEEEIFCISERHYLPPCLLLLPLS